jgi:hypothetical protein
MKIRLTCIDHEGKENISAGSEYWDWRLEGGSISNLGRNEMFRGD